MSGYNMSRRRSPHCKNEGGHRKPASILAGGMKPPSAALGAAFGSAFAGGTELSPRRFQVGRSWELKVWKGKTIERPHGTANSLILKSPSKTAI